jgi:Protein of unknown function (DUF2528)
MIKKFKIANSQLWFWECTVKIDVERADTLEAIKDMIDFWTGSEERLEANNGDQVKTFVQQLAREIFYIQSADMRLNIEGIKKEFENREGWGSMDGSLGIWIDYVEDLEFGYDIFEVEEVPNA